jgi:2-oxoacid:acceptor oxidoreductase gamma subunit (pyruvate/2-ketoisovalerate family)
VKDGIVVANTEKTVADLKQSLKIEKAKVYTVNAVRVALDILGRPIYNTAMLGALVKASPLVKMESLDKVVKERFPGAVGEKNVAVIKRAYEEATSVE